MVNFLKKYWKTKVIKEVSARAFQHRQIENKQIIDTMISLANIEELTPERYECFIKILSNQQVGEKNG